MFTIFLQRGISVRLVVTSARIWNISRYFEHDPDNQIPTRPNAAAVNHQVIMKTPF